MTNLQLTSEIVEEIKKGGWAGNWPPFVDELYRRAGGNNPKQPYQIKYKWTNNNRDIDDMKALTVWGTSPLAACQTLVDANDWRGQDMEFKVAVAENTFECITSKQLE